MLRALLTRNSGKNMAPEGSRGSSTSPEKKLEGYYELVKDIVERAMEADEAGHWERSVPLYTKGLEVINEALQLRVPSIGLLPRADKVVSMKSEMKKWEQHISRRLGGNHSGGATTSYNVSGEKKQPVVAHAPAGTTKFKITGEKRPMRQNLNPDLQQENAQKSFGSAGSVNRASKASNVSNVTNAESEKYRKVIMGDILLQNPGISWNDISGLKVAKQALYESVILPTIRADLFQGLRSPPRGLLLYGPPGNGKTFLAKALASEANATFFNISASSLTSKWVGEGEKLVRALFQVANELQPSIIFIDEIDSILSARSTGENDAMRRLKTEILIQFDGVASKDNRVVVIGATNRPQELDDAARRRMVKRIYIPLPDGDSRRSIIKHLFENQTKKLTKTELGRVVTATEGYSASDLTALCKEAAMVPLRELGTSVQSVSAKKIRAVSFKDFDLALKVIRPSVNKEMLEEFDRFTQEFGTQ